MGGLVRPSLDRTNAITAADVMPASSDTVAVVTLSDSLFGSGMSVGACADAAGVNVLLNTDGSGCSTGATGSGSTTGGVYA